MKSLVRAVSLVSLGVLATLALARLHAKQATEQPAHPTKEIVQPTVMTRYQLDVRRSHGGCSSPDYVAVVELHFLQRHTQWSRHGEPLYRRRRPPLCLERFP